jgi:hypothetical protein
VFGAGTHSREEESNVTGSSTSVAELKTIPKVIHNTCKTLSLYIIFMTVGSFGHPEHSVTASGDFLWNSNA